MHTHDTDRQESQRTAFRAALRRTMIPLTLSLAVLLVVPSAAWAAGNDVHPFLQLAIYLGGLSLLPFAVMTLTSFLRIVVVLSFIRSGLGAQNVPPNMVIIALSLFLSMFVMGPTIDRIKTDAIEPYQAGKIKSFDVAVAAAEAPLKDFMVDQIKGSNSRDEINTFYKLARDQKGPECKTSRAIPEEERYMNCLATPKQLKKEGPVILPLRVIIPAFITSELKKAFIMGFAVLIPFLVIDMVISNILLSLGMFMVPPVVISLPFKILLFVLAGGWSFVVEILVKGFNY